MESSMTQKLDNYLLEYRSWSIWKTIILGQICSLVVCLLAFLSSQLTKINVPIPIGQNYLHYMFLCAIYTTWLACRKGEKGLISVLKSRGVRYILVAFIDVQANILNATAYQYTTLISIQLLDCVGIPIALALSCLSLGIRYRFVHIFGVSICLMGVGCLVWADIDGTTSRTISGQNQLVGDMLSLGGAILLSLVFVLQELTVKTLDCVEFLGMLGLFGSIICASQMYLLEKNTLMEVNWENKEILVLLLIFAIVQFVFCSFVALVLKNTGATALQLYLLTADFYALISGIIMHKFKFHGLYFLSFLLSMTGVYIFSIKKTPIAQLQSVPNSDQQIPPNALVMNNVNSHPVNIFTTPPPVEEETSEEEQDQLDGTSITPYMLPLTEQFELTTPTSGLAVVSPTTSADLLLSAQTTTTGFSSFYGS